MRQQACPAVRARNDPVHEPTVRAPHVYFALPVPIQERDVPAEATPLPHGLADLRRLEHPDCHNQQPARPPREPRCTGRRGLPSGAIPPPPTCAARQLCEPSGRPGDPPPEYVGSTGFCTVSAPALAARRAWPSLHAPSSQCARRVAPSSRHQPPPFRPPSIPSTTRAVVDASVDAERLTHRAPHSKRWYKYHRLRAPRTPGS